MISEDHKVFDTDDVVFAVWIIVFEVLQDLKFYSGLVLEFTLVFDNFNCNVLASFPIFALHSLSKSTLAESFKNFVPIAKVVSHADVVVTPFVIITVVHRTVLSSSLYFISGFNS